MFIKMKVIQNKVKYFAGYVCEERGSGIHKAIIQTEQYQLPEWA